MPRVVDIRFDVNGATTGRQAIPHDGEATGNFNVFLAWDANEVLAGRTVRATIKLTRPGLLFGRTLTRDKATVSAADPVVPNFVYPGALAVAGPLMGWKVTTLETSYTYACLQDIKLYIESSRGDSFSTPIGTAEETVRALITLRDAGERYDRTAGPITVFCEPAADDASLDDDIWRGPSEPVSYNDPTGQLVLLDRKLDQLLLEEAARRETQMAEVLNAIVAAYGPPGGSSNCAGADGHG